MSSAISRCPRKSCSVRLMGAPSLLRIVVPVLQAQRCRDKSVGATIVRLALPPGDQDFRRAGLGGIGVEALAFLETLAPAEPVGARLAIRRAPRAHRTNRTSRHHRARLGEPRDRL